MVISLGFISQNLLTTFQHFTYKFWCSTPNYWSQLIGNLPLTDITDMLPTPMWHHPSISKSDNFLSHWHSNALFTSSSMYECATLKLPPFGFYSLPWSVSQGGIMFIELNGEKSCCNSAIIVRSICGIGNVCQSSHTTACK